MKKTFFNFSISFFISFMLGILIALILAILKSNQTLNSNVADICITSLSIIIFFLFGFIFSFRQKKRGLLNGLILIIFYLIIFFALKCFNLENSPLYLTISRIASIMIGSLFGVNLAFKNGQKD